MILTNILGMKIHRDIIVNVRNLHIYEQKINSFALITINIFCENILVLWGSRVFDVKSIV